MFAIHSFTFAWDSPWKKPCEHVVGAVTFGFGDQDPGFKGTIGEAKLHSDVVIMSPKIILDNQTLVENNKIINM